MQVNKIKVDRVYEAPDMGQIVNRAIIKPMEHKGLYKGGCHLHERRYAVYVWPMYRRMDPAIDRVPCATLEQARNIVRRATIVPEKFTQDLQSGRKI